MIPHGPQCHFCGTVQRPLAKSRIPIPANGSVITGYVCNDEACIGRLRVRLNKEVITT